MCLRNPDHGSTARPEFEHSSGGEVSQRESSVMEVAEPRRRRKTTQTGSQDGRDQKPNPADLVIQSKLPGTAGFHSISAMMRLGSRG
jgi:hypothetical protein